MIDNINAKAHLKRSRLSDAQRTVKTLYRQVITYKLLRIIKLPHKLLMSIHNKIKTKQASSQSFAKFEH